MGVYIKGMEMPEEHTLYTLTIFHNGYVAIYDVKDSFIGETKAVPVPPHGDLIERRAAYDKIAEQEGGNYVDMDAVDMGLNETPTIIPAEEGE